MLVLIRGKLRDDNIVIYIKYNIFELRQQITGQSNSEMEKYITIDHKESFGDRIIEWDRGFIKWKKTFFWKREKNKYCYIAEYSISSFIVMFTGREPYRSMLLLLVQSRCWSPKRTKSICWGYCRYEYKCHIKPSTEDCNQKCLLNKFCKH